MMTRLWGGQGGNGAASSAGNGGRGGDGGSAGGVVTFGVGSLDVSSNSIANVLGGHGGNGGTSSAGTGIGGNGGNGGGAAGVQSTSSASSAQWTLNFFSGITAGSAGDGGSASIGNFGNGGMGADAYGFLTGQSMNGDANGNTVQTVRGGHGGNSTNGPRGTAGGNGGQVSAFWALGVDGSASIRNNWFTDLTGGTGGSGRSAAGAGGNATGILSVGDGNAFNVSTVQWNTLSQVTGGIGGIGTLGGGSGGPVSGLAAFHVALISDSNVLDTLIGGRGGNSFIPANPAGRGGDSTAFIAALVPAGNSYSDTLQTVTKGAAGTGTGSPKSYGVGALAIGNTTTQTRLTLTNMTLTAISDLDLSIGNYTEATTVKTPFSTAKFAVQFAANLTVRNFLAVATFWPNNSTYLGGSHVHVDDDGLTAWDLTTSSGLAQWLLVTDRVYQQSTTKIHDNVTRVTVSYPGASFWSNPRSVDMATSHTENFGMVDVTAPTSSALPLPTYKNTLTFGITYIYDDGNGTGVQSVTLWYRGGGLATWTLYATQVVPNAGGFSFTASGDGTYEFYTTATDKAGNSQAPPSGNFEIAPWGNDTWTIVDTILPRSKTLPLPGYETSSPFSVTWQPAEGTADIASYRIEVNDNGAGWALWIASTTATSGSYSGQDGHTYQFRSIATDNAGNVESKSTNDSWTIVDMSPPDSVVTTLPPFENTVQFTVSWGPVGGTTDIATYQVQVREGAGAWVDLACCSSTTSASTSFVGQDGHSYGFRSIARDRAGNPMTQSSTFQFSTAGGGLTGGFSVGEYWWLLAVVGAVAGGALFMILRRRGSAAKAPPAAAAAEKESNAIVEDVFLLNHRDGVLIKHETRRLRPDVDTDILSGMLTAVQQFVKDALQGDDYADLNEMTVGHMHILIGRGKWLVLAARIEGDGSESWTVRIERCIKDMEDHHWDQLEDWDGDMALARVLAPYLKKLISGGYVPPNA